jgi:hypothetical protein
MALRRKLVCCVAAALLVLTAAPAAARSAPAAPYDDADYWTVADRIQQVLDPLWRGDLGRYGSGGAETSLNGQMLLTHAVAALRGHEGPARRDDRARLIARRLTATPPFLAGMPPRPWDSMTHAPGWSSDIGSVSGPQHPVFDVQVVEGLVAAWRARRQLGLTTGLADRIRREVVGAAGGPFYRWPALRLNQFNWNADMLAAAATVGGRRRALRTQLAAYIRDFTANLHATGATAGNFGPGLRFHYMPRRPVSSPLNVDSAEYASVVYAFSEHYEQARAAGMPRPPARALRLLREWGRRVLAGYWTHGGYLNWDTGFGFRRWHQAKKLGLSQQALIGMAAADELQPGRRWGTWAKWMLDRSLQLYTRWVEECGGIPPGLAFGISVDPQRPCDAALAASRVEANAARAVDAALGRARGERPPALYAYDPDTGRLAITTPTYNTAVMTVNQRAFPYGGLDLARLYDGDQEVAANVGGRPPASFGLLVRDISGRRALATQIGWPRVSRRVTPLRLVRAPRGAGMTAAISPRRAFAGPFSELHAVGTVTRGPLLGLVSHHIRPDWVETRWVARRLSGRARYTVDVLFPSWGGDAEIVAHLRDGSSTVLRRGALRLADVSWIQVRSERSGYVVVPRERPPGAVLRIMHPRPQSSDPRPGPTLAVELERAGRFGRRAFSARIATVTRGQDAGSVANRVAAGRW